MKHPLTPFEPFLPKKLRLIQHSDKSKDYKQLDLSALYVDIFTCVSAGRCLKGQ